MSWIKKIKAKVQETRSAAATRRQQRAEAQRIKLKTQRDKRIKLKKETLAEVKLDRQIAQEKQRIQKAGGGSGGMGDLFAGSSAGVPDMFGVPSKKKKSKNSQEFMI